MEEIDYIIFAWLAATFIFKLAIISFAIGLCFMALANFGGFIIKAIFYGFSGLLFLILMVVLILWMIT